MQPPTPTNIFKTGVRAGGEEIARQRKYVGGEDRYGRYSTTYRIESPQKVGRVFYPAGHAPAGSDTGLAYAARQLRQDTITATAKDDSPGTCDWDKDGRPNCSVSVNPSSIDLSDTGWNEPGNTAEERRRASESELATLKITNEQIEAALNKCLQEIWPAPTGYLRTISGFFPTRRGISGSVWYTTTSVSGPSFTVHRETKKILNDVNSFSRQQLTEIYNEVFPGQKKKMLLGMALWNRKPLRGMSFSASHNFTANDLPERSSNRGLAGLVGLHVAVQVHELGNSIELMTGAYRGNPRAADPDSGDVYETCVYQKLR